MIEVEVEDHAWAEALPDAEALAREAAEAACAAPSSFDRLRMRAPNGSLGGETHVELENSTHPELVEGRGRRDVDLTILLADDAAVRELNARFRGRDAPTNVLSFPAAPSAAPHLGDVALAFGVCAAEARAQGKPLAHHLQHLVAHGVLHLLGWDHQDEAEAEAMEATERAILAALGAPDPYCDRSAATAPPMPGPAHV